MKINILLLSFWLVISSNCTSVAQTAYKDPMDLPVPNNSLWYRYYGAGEQASKANKPEEAKRYWMASLAELEKTTAKHKSTDLFFMVRISGIEKRLTDMYKENLATANGDSEKELNLRQEQVKTLDRMARLNRRIIFPPDRLVYASQERFEAAKKELEKRSEVLSKQRPKDANSDGASKSD